MFMRWGEKERERERECGSKIERTEEHRKIRIIIIDMSI